MSGEQRQPQHDSDVVLICNPKAGGRWKALSDILDSDEAKPVRRIVTDSIDDIAPAIDSIDEKTRLLCIYGGDGTIYRILNRLVSRNTSRQPRIALIGGGTMNVTARSCGLSRNPVKNFKEVMRAYQSGSLITKDMPLLSIKHGKTTRVGFTFAMGPIVRILDTYEKTEKGKIRAVKYVVNTLTTLWSQIPNRLSPLLGELRGQITVDGSILPYNEYSALFCNVTGKLNPGVDPFVKTRGQDSFYYLAYSAKQKEISLLAPFLMRGKRPIDTKPLLQPLSVWKKLATTLVGQDSFPIDPRYINSVCKTLSVTAEESIYTIDGEIIDCAPGEQIDISLGNTIQLTVGKTVGLGPTMTLASKGVDKVLGKTKRIGPES